MLMQGNQVIIFIMILFVLISAYFSAVREAYASLSRSRIKTMVDQGNKRAALVYKLSECNDKLSSTILICNYLVNFVLVSMTAVLLIQYAGPVGGALIATVIVTVVELFFIEILPKSIAREIPERCAIFAGAGSARARCNFYSCQLCFVSLERTDVTYHQIRRRSTCNG